ncbi:LexA family transcriptional regulator [Enterobacter cloacae complex sp. P31C]|uniref:LexA family protein n=1 Tax=Enterobacter cloacae complex sp. P31C TaxID=2779560 RepID=UPI0018661C1D|nr:XRE family transcriptional regulator [Enterobacter cloacae complex sp. P31C]MBE3289554.1 helix-turn-helix domain-containing protein [Enterobacter cloacae complex sp. P31C]
MEKKKDITPTQAEDAKRLKAIYEAKKKVLGVTQQSIADELDITQGAVGHYLNGRNPLNLPVASVFARLLKVSVEEFSPTLAKELSEMGLNSVNEPSVPYVIGYTAGKRYPVISSVQAGSWCEALEPYSIKDVDQWLESDAHIQGDAFWLRVEGDSMTAPAGLSIPEGTFVLFDTGREPINGSLVIAKLSDSNEATFKKLIIDGGQKYLKGLNPQWPLVPINGNCRIIGVAIETKLRLV